MNKKLLALILAKFEVVLQTKTGWGRNEILNAYKTCVSEAILELLEP